MSNFVLTTDFVVALHNNKNCGTGMSECDMIKLLKKIGKSNGFQKFAITIDKSYLKYIKNNTYQTQEIDTSKLDDFYKDLYKNAVDVFHKE